jgi:hypothetical protein
MGIALIALFVALGGVGYAAATISSGDIVNNSIRSRDIRNNSLLSRDIHNRSVRNRDIARNTIEGSRINESKLGTVPSAATTDGHNFARINYRAGVGTPTGTILNFGGLLVNATCAGGPNLNVTATPTSNNGMIHVGTIVRPISSSNPRPAYYDDDNDFDVGQSINVLAGRDTRITGTLTYTNVFGSVVTLTYMAEEASNALGGSADCFFIGEATQSG